MQIAVRNHNPTARKGDTLTAANIKKKDGRTSIIRQRTQYSNSIPPSKVNI